MRIARRAHLLVLALALPAVTFHAHAANVSAQRTATQRTATQPTATQRTATQPPMPIFTTPAQMAENSPNWGGYVASGRKFRYVKATFAVPRLDCAKTPGKPGNPTFVGEWVGLDATTVEQDGIQAECDGRNAEYAAWYEMYPKAAAYPPMTVNPGDTIQASVWYAANKQEYELILSDLSNGEGFTEWARCGGRSCANSTAEVITEAPGKSGAAKAAYFPLADCGTTSFTAISITDAVGQRGTFASAYWQSTRFEMEDNSGQVKAAISGLIGNGGAFRTYWEHES